MACALQDETEDLVTCSVCLYEYDEVVRKPKFLICSHTLCLHCAKAIEFEQVVICPLCRKPCPLNGDASSLPNNSYALHMLKLNSGRELKPPQPPALVALCWHRTTKHVESLKAELLRLQDVRRDILARAISKRMEIRTFLEASLKALDSALSDVKERQDLNNVELAEMASLLEAGDKPASADSSDSLQQLAALVEDALPDDPLETLRQKMNSSVHRCEQQLRETLVLADAVHRQKSMRISVQLFNEMNQPVELSEPVDEGSLLLRHAVFALNKGIRTVSVNTTVKKSAVPDVPREPARSRFVLGQSTFVVVIKQYENPCGEIHILPAADFHPTFIQQLGDFCFRQPKPFVQDITKAVPGVFVLLSMSNPKFRPTVPKMAVQFSTAGAHRSFAERSNDVGLMTLTAVTGNHDVISGWEFLFPLERFSDKKYAKHLNRLTPAPRFGRVVKGLDHLEFITSTSRDERTTFTFTLESR